MFLLFTPFTFLFFCFYLVVLLSLFFFSSFVIFWVFMEVLMLLFMGVCYTIFINNYSQLLVYFLIQALASFGIFLFYIYCNSLFLTLFLLFKLSMFPFLWFINVVYFFPNFVLWLVSTFNKLPVLIMVYYFNFDVNVSVLWSSYIFSSLASGVLMLNATELRYVLIVSSIGNNSWFLISQSLGGFMLLLFFVFYSLALFFIFFNFEENSKNMVNSVYSLIFWVVFISGLPPFPVFFVKMWLVMNMFMLCQYNFVFLVFLLTNVLMLGGYIFSLFSLLIMLCKNHTNIFLQY